MIKKLLITLLLIILLVLLLKSCLHRDVVPEDIETSSASFDVEIPPYPGDFNTKNIAGREFLVARGKIGKFGGTLYTSTIGEGPKTFNPWNSKDATSSTLAGLMFDGLTTTDAYTGLVVPKMAKSIDVDESGKIYTVKLRKGLRWSDGEEITADDVVFTWNDLILSGFGNTSMRDTALIDGIAPEVKKIDKYTIEFKTPKPFAPFVRQLGNSIAPKHVLGPIVKKGKKEFDTFWGVTTNPNDFVTSGMFRLEGYVAAQRVKFKKNPDYYMIDKNSRQLPYLDNYVVYIVGDLNNEVLKFEAREIDYLGVGGKNVAKFKEFEKKSDYTMYNLGPNTGTTFILFNLNRRKNSDGKFYVDPVKQRWFNDYNFRKAVDYAIDREFMVSNILGGVGAPLFTAESLSSIFLNEELKNGHARNIKLAKQLLKESGFILDENGQLLDQNGNMVEFTLLTNAGNTERESCGVMIKEDLEQLGIKVNFKPIEFNVLVGKLTDSMDWESIILGLTGSPLEPHEGINVWSSTGALHMFNLRKGNDLETKADLRYWEEDLDNIFKKGAQELDFEKRKTIYDEYQKIVYEQRPMIYLYSGLSIIAVRNKLGNILPTPLGGVFHNLEEIYIK